MRTFRTFAGVIAVDAVAPTPESEVTEKDARQASFESGAALLHELADYPDGRLYRVSVRLAGPDPRVALRQDAELSEAEVEEIRQKIAALGARAKDGPWAFRVLRAIEDRPGVPRPGWPGRWGWRRRCSSRGCGSFEKELGLTESLEIGYRLSPRGEAFLSALGRPVIESHFKGWARPGPIPPGATASDAPAPEETLDAISGYFRIYQLRDGHRFSTDDVLTASDGTTWVPTAHASAGPGVGHRLRGDDRRLAVAGRALRDDRSTGRKRRAGAAILSLQRAGWTLRDSRGRFPRRRHPERRQSASSWCSAARRTSRPAPGVEGDDPAEGGLPLRASRRRRRLRARRRRRTWPPADCSRASSRRGSGPARRSGGWRRPGWWSCGGARSCSEEGEPPLITLFGLMRATDLPEAMRARTWVEPPLVIRTAAGDVHPEYAAVKLAVGFPP